MKRVRRYILVCAACGVVVVLIHITPSLVNADRLYVWRDRSSHTVIAILGRCGIPYGIKWPYIGNYNPLRAEWSSGVVQEYPDRMARDSVMYVRYASNVWKAVCIDIRRNGATWKVQQIRPSESALRIIDATDVLILDGVRVWFSIMSGRDISIAADDYIFDPKREAYGVAFEKDGNVNVDNPKMFKRFPWDTMNHH